MSRRRAEARKAKRERVRKAARHRSTPAEVRVSIDEGLRLRVAMEEKGAQAMETTHRHMAATAAGESTLSLDLLLSADIALAGDAIAAYEAWSQDHPELVEAAEAPTP